MTQTETTLGGARLTLDMVVDVARGNARLRLDPSVAGRVAAARAVVERLAGADVPVYGLTTGLGAGVDTRLTADDRVAFQRRAVPARAVGVGPRLPTEVVRAMMMVRAAGFAAGGSGASAALLDALVAALNACFHPVVPSKGSIGADDLAPLAHLGRALLGDPEAQADIGADIGPDTGGVTLPADVALARAGLVPPVLGVKDGHALVVANALSVGLGCLVLEDARIALDALDAAAALSCEGFRANLEPLDPRVAAARPAPGQAAAAARLRALLAGGDLTKPGAARRLQDPSSFRCLASAHGAARVTLDAAREPVEIELNAAADNPLVAVSEGETLHNGNFDTTALVLRFEALGQALAQVATMAAHRTMKLMSPEFSGLPRFLTPQGQSRTGFATVQKTIAALEAEIRHRALPISLGVLPVADGVEDHASMAPAVVAKTGEIVERLRWLTAIELAAAAQAVDLRGPLTLGVGARITHAAVRQRVAPLSEDRAQGPDFERLAAAIADGAITASLFNAPET